MKRLFKLGALALSAFVAFLCGYKHARNDCRCEWAGYSPIPEYLPQPERESTATPAPTKLQFRDLTKNPCVSCGHLEASHYEGCILCSCELYVKEVSA